MQFIEAVQHILRFEGGYVNDPDDAGGETKYGISKRSYPDVDIAALTMAEAADIYERDYWDAVKAGQLPPALRLPVFDMAVNMGTNRAIRIMQEAVGATPDGIIGPKTLQAAWAMNEAAQKSLLRHRVDFYVGLVERKPSQIKFLRGWLRRAIEVS